MGLTYKELSKFGALRKVHKLGPYGCFLRLQSEWHAEGMTPREIADKVSYQPFYFFCRRNFFDELFPTLSDETRSLLTS